MLSDIKLRCKHLGENYKNQAGKNGKEPEYLSLQERILDEEHSKMEELSQDLGERTNELMENVGL
jgi:hypothetical protein